MNRNRDAITKYVTQLYVNMGVADTRVPCSTETRDEILRPLKRGGESYDSLLRRMAAQYDPERETEPLSA